ncbi:hypothetical protein D3C75_645560 [compost metagenome]
MCRIAVFINSRYTYGDCIAIFRIIPRDGSTNDGVTTGLNFADPIFARNGIDGEIVDRKVININLVIGGDGNFVARSIMRGDGSGECYISVDLIVVIAKD